MMPTCLIKERLRPIPGLDLRGGFAVVATLASRDDVAKVMLAALADRNHMLYVEVAVNTAVGAAVIELHPPAPQLIRTEQERCAATLLSFPALGLVAVVEPEALVGHVAPAKLARFELTNVLIPIQRV